MSNETQMTTSRKFPATLFAGLMAMDVAILLVEKKASINASGHGFDLLLSYASQPWLWVTLAIKIAALFTWAAILTKASLSRVFPLTALATPIAMLLAVALFNEHPAPSVWIGAGIIVIGVMLAGPPTPHETESAPKTETVQSANAA